jgi:hypothetical protein
MENSIFFGNGLNRLGENNVSWEDLLAKIKGNNNFKSKNLPNTMIYERAFLEDKGRDEKQIKKTIADDLGKMQTNSLYQRLFELDAKHYITTNYDNSFVDSLPNVKLSFPKSHPETSYSIRRLKKIVYDGVTKNFWQIHGEIKYPISIMLGLDHYCRYIGKIDSYIKGEYKYSIGKKEITEPKLTDKLRSNEYNNSSWIELFFETNMHIIGFSFDFSETDLWWLINKRARFKRTEKIQNEIHFYCDEKFKAQKRGLLKSFDVTVHKYKLSRWCNKYIDFYTRVIDDIENKIGTNPIFNSTQNNSPQ